MDEHQWPKKILEWKLTTKRIRGRPPEVWLTQTKKDMERRNLQDGEWNYREAWAR